MAIWRNLYYIRSRRTSKYLGSINTKIVFVNSKTVSRKYTSEFEASLDLVKVFFKTFDFSLYIAKETTFTGGYY